jgi:hypothetical protein
VFVLREGEEIEWPDRSTDALFPADPAFAGMSYSKRYQEMMKRFISDNIYLRPDGSSPPRPTTQAA